MFFWLIPILVFAQPFPITNVSRGYYSIDRFTGDVYVEDIVNYKIIKINLRTMIQTDAIFPTLPAFANKSHKAVYANGHTEYTDLYLYDFDRDTSYKLIDSIWNVLPDAPYSFSPNDHYVSVPNKNGFYSLKDNNFIYKRLVASQVEWSSDTSLVYSKKDGSRIMESNIVGDRTDTILSIDPNFGITSFTCNLENNTIIYSIHNAWNTIVKIFDRINLTDSIIYKWPCNFCPMVFEDLRCSPLKNKIGFLLFNLTTPNSLIITYYIDSNLVIINNEFSDIGLEYNLEWYDQDTMIYYNATRFMLSGYKLLNSTVSVKNEKNYDNVKFYNNPNPFYTSTFFQIESTNNIKGTILIYNLLGQLIKTLDIDLISNKVSINWDGTNNYGQKISSGLYFALFCSKNNNLVSKKLIKLFLIK